MKKFVKRFVSILMVLAVLMSISITAAAAGNDFSDVSRTKWSYKAVMNAREKGYVNGVGGNKFDPYGKLTYAQLSQVIYNMAGKPRYLLGRGPGGLYSSYSDYFTHPSIVGDVKTKADCEAWVKWFKGVYPCNGDGIPTTAEYIDLQAADCVDQCKKNYWDDVVFGYDTPGDYDNSYRSAMTYKVRGKWFTSAFLWARQMGFIPHNKTAYDLATREDVVAALRALNVWTSDYYADGEWVPIEEVESEDGVESIKAKIEEDGGVRAGIVYYGDRFGGYSYATIKVEDGQIYVFELYRGRYAYLEEEYEGVNACYGAGWAIENHILAGNGSLARSGKKALNLKDNVTREEFAQFLYNYDVNIG